MTTEIRWLWLNSTNSAESKPIRVTVSMVKDLGQHIHISINISLNVRLSVSLCVSLSENPR